MYDSFGSRLRSERKRIGKTQVELCRLANTTVQTQRKYESNRTVPNSNYLALVAAQGIDIHYLVTGSVMHISTSDVQERTQRTIKAISNLREALVGELYALEQAETCQQERIQISSVGCRLKEERSRIGLNQHQMGEAGGASKNTQLAYESGKSSPTAKYLLEIAKTGADITYVLTGKRKA